MYVVVTIHPVCMSYSPYRWDGLWLRHTDGMNCDYDIQMGWIVTTTYRWDGLWLRHTNSSRLYVVLTIHPICVACIVTIHPICMSYSQSNPSVYGTRLWLRHTDGTDCDYDIQMGWIVTTTYRRDGLWLRHTDRMDYDYDNHPSRLYVVVTIHPICMS
jgi:hypothetical protein